MTVLALAVLPVMAQTSQVATLSHEGSITTFYSGNALKDAYAAAVDGDVITLSSGTFNSVSDLRKNITVRGAGMMADADPTILSGDIYVKCPVSEANNLTFEGFYLNGSLYFDNTIFPADVRIVKCQIKRFDFSNVKNITVVNTFASDFNTGSRSSGNFINCYLGNASGSGSCESASFTNCVVWCGTNGLNYFSNNTFKNCIIGSTGSANVYFNASAIATHCYYYGEATNPFRHSPSTTNVVKNDMGTEDIFSDTGLHILKEELQNSWLGDDGTQVGIYGGFLPFDPTPTNPQITKFNVASKTTADGKLSVDIEVKAN